MEVGAVIATLLLGIVAVIGGQVVGVVLHELAHALAAVGLGAEVHAVGIDGVVFAVDGAVRERLVLLAPAIVGLASLPPLLWLWSGRISWLAVAAAMAWIRLTLTGGTEGEIGVSRYQTDAART